VSMTSMEHNAVVVLSTALVMGQCFVAAFLLAIDSRGRRDRSEWLALFFGLTGLLALGDLLDDFGVFSYARILAALWPLVGISVAPSLYLYTRASVSPNAVTPAFQNMVHFVPAILALAIFIPLYWIQDLKQSPGGWTNIEFVHWLSLSEAIWFGRLILLVQVAVYLAMSLHLLIKHQSGLTKFLSTIEDRTIARLRFTIVLVTVPWGTHLLQGALTLAFPLGEAVSTMFAVVRSLSVFILAVIAIRVPTLADPVLQEDEAASRRIGRYAKTNLSQDDINRITDKLHQAMKVGLAYRDPNLTLRQLSDLTRVPEHRISQVLNLHLNCTFFSFVNGWRVVEAQRMLADTPPRTVQDIWLEVGFNSKSTFNKAFKQVTGRTPSQSRSVPLSAASE